MYLAFPFIPPCRSLSYCSPAIIAGPCECIPNKVGVLLDICPQLHYCCLPVVGDSTTNSVQSLRTMSEENELELQAGLPEAHKEEPPSGDTPAGQNGQQEAKEKR